MSETADTIVVRLLAQTEQARRDVLGYGRSVERSMTSVEVAVSRAGDTATRAADKQREAYRQLGTSVVSAAADAMNGKNAFQILGEQGTSVAASLAGFGGVVGRVAGFLSGPWGAAITAAISVAGLFATRTDETTQAVRGEGEAARTLGEAIDDLDKISGASIVSKERARQAARRSVEAYLAENRAARDAAGGIIVLAKAKLAEAEARSIDPTLAGEGGFNGGAVAASGYASQIAAQEAKLATLRDEWIAGLGSLRMDRSSQLIEDIEGELDPILGAERKIAAGIERLRDLHKVYLISDADFRAKARALMRQRPGVSGSQPAADRASGREELTPAPLRAGAGDTVADLQGGEAKIAVQLLPVLSDDELMAQVRDALAGLPPIDVSKAGTIDLDQIEKMAKISAGLADDLSKGLTDAILAGKSLGDVLVDSFARAGAALIQSQILRMLNPNGDGSAGFVKEVGGLLGSLVRVSEPAGRASGGHVSAGQLYRVNEGGVEGFRPAGSGTIVPLGRMAAARGGGGVTIVQPLNVSFAGAITTPELMAQFKAYADGVGQAAAMGSAAMAQARMSKRAARALGR